MSYENLFFVYKLVPRAFYKPELATAMGFNAKDLTYGIYFPLKSMNESNKRTESNEPAFLRRLRSQHGGGDSARHERPLARPRKHVNNSDEDDQPTYVVEGRHDTLSKVEYEALLGSEKAEEQDGKDTPSPVAGTRDIGTRDENNASTKGAAQTKQHVTAIGALNKRRLPKVVGDGDEGGGGIMEESKPSGKKAKAKTGKKVKLSFDEEAL